MSPFFSYRLEVREIKESMALIAASLQGVVYVDVLTGGKVSCFSFEFSHIVGP